MDLNELDKAFDKILQEFPQARKKLVENTGDKLYKKVLVNIEANVKEHTGNLKKGVIKHIGSGEGYAVVRPSQTVAPHTHLIENGHKIVRGDEFVGWAPGKHMYRNALNELANELEQNAEKMLDDLVGDF